MAKSQDKVEKILKKETKTINKRRGFIEISEDFYLHKRAMVVLERWLKRGLDIRENNNHLTKTRKIHLKHPDFLPIDDGIEEKQYQINFIQRNSWDIQIKEVLVYDERGLEVVKKYDIYENIA